MANWAGLPVAVLEPIARRLQLRRFHEEAGAELLDVNGGPLRNADTAVPVRFLPTWDATLLAHARRTHILREEHRPLLFSSRSPQSRSVCSCSTFDPDRDQGETLGDAVRVEAATAPAGLAVVAPASGRPRAAGLYAVRVAPWARGRGVGSALVEAAIERARAVGYSTMVLGAIGTSQRSGWSGSVRADRPQVRVSGVTRTRHGK